MRFVAIILCCFAVLFAVGRAGATANAPASTRPATLPATQPASDSGTNENGPSTPPVKDEVRQVVFMLDGSGSMMGRRRAVAIRILSAEVSALDDSALFQVVFFQPKDDSDCHWLGNPKKLTMLKATPESMAEFEKALQKYSPAGNTLLAGPLKKVLTIPGRPKEIVLITDGLEAIKDPLKLPNEVRILNRHAKAKINVIMVRNDPSEYNLKPVAELREVLEKIAHDSGGTFRRVNASEE